MDTIIPLASQGTQAWDRYAGMNNNPIRFNDPSGHDVGCAGDNFGYCHPGVYTPQPSPRLTITTPSAPRVSGIVYSGPATATPTGPAYLPGPTSTTAFFPTATSTPTPTPTPPGFRPTPNPVQKVVNQANDDVTFGLTELVNNYDPISASPFVGVPGGAAGPWDEGLQKNLAPVWLLYHLAVIGAKYPNPAQIETFNNVDLTDGFDFTDWLLLTLPGSTKPFIP